MLVMPDFKTLVTSWGARTIHVMDVRKRKPERIIDVRNGYLSNIKLSPDGKILILGMTAEVQFRDARTFKLLRTYNHGGQGTSVDLGKSSRIIRCRWSGMKPHYVDVKTAKRISTPRSTLEFDVIFSPNGKYFVEIRNRNQLELWKSGKDKSQKLKTLNCDLVEIQTVQFSPDNKMLAVGGSSSTENPVRFYKLSDIRASNKSL